MLLGPSLLHKAVTNRSRKPPRLDAFVNSIFTDFVHEPMSSDGPTIMKKKNSMPVVVF